MVNAAGLGAKQISDLLGLTGYRVIGSRSNYIILHKRRTMASHPMRKPPHGTMPPMPTRLRKSNISINTWRALFLLCKSSSIILAAQAEHSAATKNEVRFLKFFFCSRLRPA